MRRFASGLRATASRVPPVRARVAGRADCVLRHQPAALCPTKHLQWPLSRPASTLTREQPSYQHVARGDFAQLASEDVAFFEGICPGRTISDETDLAQYNEDWLGNFRGSSQVCIRPKTTEEMSKVIAYCNERNLAVNPQGGNTGLVGGSVPVFDEVVVSTSLMKEVISLDRVSGILTCQAGCVLEELDNYLGKEGFMMPLDLGAKGSCQIGGNVSTNAGGIRLLRYGSLHGTVLGVEAVLPSGEVVSTLSGLQKDNTGYDLKQLFIGAEGTLGVVTAVAIKVPQRPNAINAALLGCETYEACQETLKLAKTGLGEVLSAFEFFDDGSMVCANKHLQLDNPLAGEYPFYVLVETHGSVQDHDMEKLELFLGEAMEQGHVVDGVVAQDTRQMSHFWAIREGLAQALKHDGYVYKYDVSLPVPVLYDMVTEMKERTQGVAVSCVGYGHLGDGNLHLNITGEGQSEELLALIEPFVYEFTAKHNGSVSAEHGLGLMKPHKIHYSKSPQAVAMMRAIKGLVDPKGIMNPYKTVFQE